MSSLFSLRCPAGQNRLPEKPKPGPAATQNDLPRPDKPSSSSLTARGVWQGAMCWSLVLAAGFAAFPVAACGQTTLTQLRKQTHQLLRSEALADDEIEQQQCLAALCDLYVVLRLDDRYAKSDTLWQDAHKIRRRLLTESKRLKAKLRRQNIARPTTLTADVDQALANAKNHSESQSKVTAADLRQGRAAAGIADNGWQLIELIQRVVAPDFWETRGGPGTIQYFAMRRVLVVRATTDVHEQVRDLLLALSR